jgi:hypothetical protein
MGGLPALNDTTSSSDSGAALRPVVTSAAVRGNFSSRSWRMLEVFAASLRSAATLRCAPEMSLPAAAPSASSPVSPAASRVGSTMPGSRVLPVVSWPSSSCHLSLRSGQPSFWAIGAGMASTTGLSATGMLSVGTKPGASPPTRSSQLEESGTHTSGTTGLPAAAFRPESATPCLAAMVAAAVAGSVAATATLMQTPPTWAFSPCVHLSAVVWMAPAISAAAVTASFTSPEQSPAERRW